MRTTDQIRRTLQKNCQNFRPTLRRSQHNAEKMKKYEITYFGPKGIRIIATLFFASYDEAERWAIQKHQGEPRTVVEIQEIKQ